MRNAAAGGASRLHRLDLAPVHGAFAIVVDERLQGSSERHLDQAGVFYFSDQRKDFGAGTLRAAGFTEPCRTAHHDRSDVVPGLNIVDVGGLAPEPLLSRERRTRTWSS